MRLCACMCACLHGVRERVSDAYAVHGRRLLLVGVFVKVLMLASNERRLPAPQLVPKRVA